MQYASGGDSDLEIVMAATVKRVEEIIDSKITLLARAIRNEIAEAWNAGNKKADNK